MSTFLNNNGIYAIAGNVSATGNITGNYILGNGALLTGVITSAANINNGTSNVNVVSSGGNVTVGVGGTGNVAVFATTGEYVTGLISANGTVTGGNLSTGGTASATGNVTGGNILTGGLISATGNITGGNILGGANVNATTHTGTTVSVTANITGGNVLTGGLISATANVTGGNILTGGLISATGNVTGGNVSTGAATLTGLLTVAPYIETIVAVGTVGSTSTLSLASGTILTATLTPSTQCVFTMPTATAGKSFILYLTQAASGMTNGTFTGVKWPGGTPPTITTTASGIDIISFICVGSTWFGNAAQAFA